MATARRRPQRSKPAEADAASSSARILDEAERLFAESGYNGVSVRAIAGAARANISSVYYHFGSKKDLLEAVCRRHMEPLIEERRARMAACAKSAPASEAEIERLIAAFIAPVIHKAVGDSPEAMTFRKFAGYLATDPSPEVRSVMAKIYDESVRAFVEAMRRVYPDHPAESFAWGLICTLGAVLYAQTDAARMRQILNTSSQAADGGAVVRLVTRYIMGGMRDIAGQPS